MLEMLGCFPLALTQALAFIKHNRTTVTHYKRVLEQDIRSSSERLRDLEFRDIRRYGDIPVSVFRTWEVSFGKLHQSELPAAKLLAGVSFFDAALGVPETLLWSEGSDLLAFTTALGTLLSFSMVTLGANGSVLMHPLVQQAVHGYITRQGSIEAYLLEGSSRIAVALIYGSRSYWEQLNKLAAHVKEVLSHISNTDSLRKDVALNRATLLLHTARFLNFRSQNSTALEHAEEAYDIRYKTLGGADVDTIESLEAISFILAAQRHYRAAEMKQRAVVEARHLTSPGDVLTVRSKWALADILIVCGQLKEASELCDTLKGAVECEWRRTRTMFHLAQALKGSNRVLAAEQMYRQILAEYEGNPEVAELLGKARIGLNVLLGSRGHESEAYEVYFDRIRWSVTEFGDNHPLTTEIRCELAQLYYQQGNWEAAAQLQDRAYRTYVEVLGETHPTTLAALSDLADMELKLGHPTQAEELHRRAYRQRATAEGPRDPNTLTSMQKLAELLFSMDRYEEACELLKEVVIGRRHALGRNCPETLQAIKALIFVLSQLGNLEEAEALCLEYIQLVREAVPTDDIAAADAMSQLGPILAAQGRLSEAESCYRDLLQLNANRDPSLAVRVFATLGIMLAEQQRFSEAVETYRQALAVGQAVPGMQDLLQSVSRSLQNAQRLQENPNRWHFYRSGPKSAAQGLEPDDRSRSNESGNFQSTTMRGLVARLKRRRPN
ncbi:hypothetical protein ASPCAL14252 [Aspergillus calidoustus]|uniref:Uncharacterized protein n=1 Tax=Aspergillus calidoustus TaxID=454130 RepID=A0A0U5GGL1_ASPCI|nr:hypothetical protein ASPCAL14252 [Aspergillus calidoustus]